MTHQPGRPRNNSQKCPSANPIPEAGRGRLKMALSEYIDRSKNIITWARQGVM
jgi:hypothetical protein